MFSFVFVYFAPPTTEDYGKSDPYRNVNECRSIVSTVMSYSAKYQPLGAFSSPFKFIPIGQLNSQGETSWKKERHGLSSLEMHVPVQVLRGLVVLDRGFIDVAVWVV